MPFGLNGVLTNMALFPMPRKSRSFQGPHSHCLLTAESQTKRFSRNRESLLNCMLRTSLTASHIRFIIYFSVGLFSMVAMIMTALLFAVCYFTTRLFLRFQYKLAILFVMLDQRRLDFHKVNGFCIYWLHVFLLFIGGFGWVSLLYFDI